MINVLTMSSREIADLTGKQHFNVLNDIRSMLRALGFTDLDFQGSYIDSTGRTLPCFNLPKDLTMSSREIAELTGKQHKNVLWDIRAMLDELGMTSAEFSANLPDSYGRPQSGFCPPKDLTMSSREIADLLGCSHDNVKVAIKRLIDRDVITQPAMQDECYKDGSGRTAVMSVYRIGKRDSYVIVAQLSPEFTAKLVDR